MADLTAEDAPPDFASLPVDALPLRASKASTEDGAVVVPADVWQLVQAHARSRLDVEVGGILLGAPHRDADGRRYLLIDGHVPALSAPSQGSSVTFTADAWVAIHDAIDRDRPGAAIVGWYHTHPRFGIFLSPMDVFIQRHFFALPHQVAVVLDPVAGDDGAFVWRAGEPTRVAVCVEAGRSRRRRSRAARALLRLRAAWRAVTTGLRRPPRRR